MRTFSALTLCLVTASPVLAQQAKVDPVANARFGALRSQADPYRSWFTTTPDLSTKVAAVERQPQASKRKVVCGMTMIEPDLRVDPGFAKPAPNGGPEPKVRVVEPAICWSSR
ncbi:MAG TPA: hypothetical protein VEC39_10435 [Vicinamibacterales bacterium]|nr:hypothetical protein [Vicinamibacterales bacterium]